MCKANCDLDYENTIAGEFFESPWAGSEWKPCGILCVEAATANRDACYGECVSDCS
jgi:hypothetical protein